MRVWGIHTCRGETWHQSPYVLCLSGTHSQTALMPLKLYIPGWCLEKNNSTSTAPITVQTTLFIRTAFSYTDSDILWSCTILAYVPQKWTQFHNIIICCPKKWTQFRNIIITLPWSRTTSDMLICNWFMTIHSWIFNASLTAEGHLRMILKR